jgi:hypothetical protein
MAPGISLRNAPERLTVAQLVTAGHLAGVGLFVQYVQRSCHQTVSASVAERYDCSSGESQSSVIWRRRDHASVVVRSGCGDSGVVWDSAHHRRNPGALRSGHRSTRRCPSRRYSHRQCTSRIRTRYSREGPRAVVIFGGIHATLYRRRGAQPGRRRPCRGDGDDIWPLVLGDATHGTLKPSYEAGRVDADRFVSARWELLPQGRYMWGSVQTVRGCPKHCSFCSV